MRKLPSMTILAAMLTLGSVSCGKHETPSSSVAASGRFEIANSFANKILDLLRGESINFAPTTIGHAIPKGADASEMEGFVQRSQDVERSVSGPIGFNQININYRVLVQSNGKYKGKGHYLANVVIVPTSVEVDPTVELTVTAMSLVPTNGRSEADPVAVLKFFVTFQMVRYGSTIKFTDEFTVNGLNGNIVVMQHPIK